MIAQAIFTVSCRTLERSRKSALIIEAIMPIIVILNWWEVQWLWRQNDNIYSYHFLMFSSYCIKIGSWISCVRPAAFRACVIPHQPQISVLLSIRLMAGGSLYWLPQIGHVFISINFFKKIIGVDDKRKMNKKKCLFGTSQILRRIERVHNRSF